MRQKIISDAHRGAPGQVSLAHLIHDFILCCGICQKTFHQFTLALRALQLHTRLFKEAGFL